MSLRIISRYMDDMVHHRVLCVVKRLMGGFESLFEALQIVPMSLLAVASLDTQ